MIEDVGPWATAVTAVGLAYIFILLYCSPPPPHADTLAYDMGQSANPPPLHTYVLFDSCQTKIHQFGGEHMGKVVENTTQSSNKVKH